MNTQCKSHDEEIIKLRDRMHKVETVSQTGLLLAEQNKQDIETNSIKIDTKIGWKVFTWAVGIMFAFMSIILGAIYVQVRENGALTNSNNSAIARIEGALNQ